MAFLSSAEWKQELNVLLRSLRDLADEHGNLKRSTDIKSDAGIAWSKACRFRSWVFLMLTVSFSQVDAVYPNITAKELMCMTVDQIIAKDQSELV